MVTEGLDQLQCVVVQASYSSDQVRLATWLLGYVKYCSCKEQKQDAFININQDVTLT